MSRPRTRRQKRICDTKIKYFDKTEAIAAANALKRDTFALNAHAYRCYGRKGQRKHWHVTSGKRRRR